MNVVAADSDSRSISKLYNNVKNNAYANLLPVVVDTANPTPAIGFRNRERASFHERVKTELVAALAVVHHLVIGRNISLRALANYLGEITERWLMSCSNFFLLNFSVSRFVREFLVTVF